MVELGGRGGYFFVPPTQTPTTSGGLVIGCFGASKSAASAKIGPRRKLEEEGDVGSPASPPALATTKPVVDSKDGRFFDLKLLQSDSVN
jgi:hypothetical protein